MPVMRSLAALLTSMSLPLAAAAEGIAPDFLEVASGLVRPVVVTDAGDGSGRLFIAQQTGEILLLPAGGGVPTEFLDLSSLVDCCGERGLLGLAFHPDYATNGELFVHYTRNEGPPTGLETVLARYLVSAGDPDVADPGSAEILLTLEQPNANHNGGDIAFGPDGYLYVSLGDGGGSGDPDENGQDLSTLYGSILRLDIDDQDEGLAYAIPPDNPFVGNAEARDEIWAWGLRNPWRFSFDRASGDLWIGDVGQGSWEEIDLQAASSPGGENYGWDCREGAHDFETTGCDGTYVDPILEYANEAARCAVIGGFRYRGSSEPRLDGIYLYGDFCSGEVWATVPRCDGVWESRVVALAPGLVTAFGEDEAGELYVTEYAGDGSATSKVHQIFLSPGSGGPDLEITPSAHAFGLVPTGESASVEVVLDNTNAGPEAVLVELMGLTGSSEFALDPNGGSAPCGTTPCLGPGTSCTVSVDLLASSEGSLAAELEVSGNFASETAAFTAEICGSDELVLSQRTVTTREVFRACQSLTAGPDFTVESTGEAIFRAGDSVVLRDGFEVRVGGALSVEIF